MTIFEWIVQVMYPEATVVAAPDNFLRVQKYAIYSRPKSKPNSYTLIPTGEAFDDEMEAWKATVVYLAARNPRVENALSLVCHIIEVSEMNLDSLEEPCTTM